MHFMMLVHGYITLVSIGVLVGCKCLGLSPIVKKYCNWSNDIWYGCNSINWW